MLYRFSVFEFESDAGDLRKNGRIVALEPQPAKVLAVLLAKAGQIVPRDELRDAVWGADTRVDFDRGIAYCPLAGWLVSRAAPAAAPVKTAIAVSIFDNESGLPEHDRLVAGLSDLVVAKLTQVSPSRLNIQRIRPEPSGQVTAATALIS